MSTAASAKKGNAFSEANEALYDPCQGSVIVCDYFADVDWPEWSDAELNAEAWDVGKSKPATASGPKGSVPASAASSPPEYFIDRESCKLPVTIKDYLCSWKRPHEAFPEAVLTVFDPTNEAFELKVPSPVAECDFFKSFTEELPVLQFYALTNGFPVEGESPTFVANTQGEAWRPWHHVYALCRAGKDQAHRPMYSPYGKYVLRLFYMGSWRRFVIDDRIPCDETGACMLPVTQVPGELWPLLLVKGLLKIMSLTPAPDISAVDLPLLSLFTGWVRGNITTVNKTREQIWRRFLALVPLRESQGEGDAKTVALSLKESTKKEEKKVADKKVDFQTENYCFLMATLEGFSDVENLSKSYKVGVSAVEVSVEVEENPQEETQTWKRIRWIYWASEKGLWAPEKPASVRRFVQSISFVTELNELLLPEDEEEEDAAEVSTDVLKTVSHPRQWSDFLKLHEYLFGLEVFFKPSVFPYRFRITCLRGATPGKPAEASASAKTPPLNSYYFLPLMKKTRNEPILMFCESAASTFLAVSLWAYPRERKHSEGYLEPCEPDLVKVSHACLIVEEFDWRDSEEGKIIGLVRTVGNSSFGLNLRPGRHLLRLWISSDCPYVADVCSSVEVIVHKGYRIRSLMTEESTEILRYVANVSNAFSTLVQKFGKPDLPVALKSFYGAIMPGNDRMVGYRSKIDKFIETFLNCIMASLKSLVPNGGELQIMLWSLRSLFLNPDIECELPREGPPPSIAGGGSKKTVKKAVALVKERTLSEILSHPWTPEEVGGVVTIQRIFRGYRVRLLWKFQLPARKESKAFADRLKKISDVMFAPQKRDFEVGKLVRNVIAASPDLWECFRFCRDVRNVIDVEEFAGKATGAEPFAWMPLARFVVASHSEEAMPCAFYLSCNLERFVIQGVDNDTNEEVFRMTNSVSPHYYRNNVRGYTIFVFGWNEASAKTVNWRLELVRMKHFPSLHLCNTLLGGICCPYGIPTLEVLELKNFYVPNKESKLCRCLIRIRKRTLLTLRLTASYSKVQFVAKIFLGREFCEAESECRLVERVVAQAESTDGVVMIPSLFLEYFEPDEWWRETDADSTLYVVEAFVLDGSWPLTRREWGTVEPIRVNGDSWRESITSLHSKKTESRKKLTRTSKRSLGEQRPVENPCWTFQVLNDSSGAPDSGNGLLFEEDRSHAESIKAMKASWEERDQGRRERGRDSRLKFLSRMHQEMADRLDGEEGVFRGEEEEREPDFLRDFQSTLDRMTNFSYLTSDPSPERLLSSPRFLPPMPTGELLQKYGNNPLRPGDSIMKFEFLKGRRSLPGEEEEKKEEKSEKLKPETEDVSDHFRTFLVNRSILLNHLAEEQKLSNKLMEEAYESRSKAVERMSR